MNEIIITKEEKEVFEYLNELRESGVTNMFSAGAYIQESFGKDKTEARQLLSKWMKYFNPDGYDNLKVI